MNDHTYETPELVELGDALELTLGGEGTCDDGCDCKNESGGGDIIIA